MIFPGHQEMNQQSQQDLLFFSTDLECFTCFGQRGHLQVIQLYTEYVSRNYTQSWNTLINITHN
jgi:hypothetical protein